MRTIIDLGMALGVVALLLGVLAYVANGSRRDTSPSTPTAPQQVRPSTRMPEPELLPEPVPDTASKLSEDQLRKACAEEIRSGSPANTGQATHCEMYAVATRRALAMEKPYVSPYVPRENPQPVTQAPTVQKRLIWFDDCRRYDYGTIKYRKCRADESKRLSDECSRLKLKRQRIGPDSDYAETVALSEAWCDAAFHYKIVK